MMRPDLRIEVTEDAGAVCLCLVGELDLATGPALQEELRQLAGTTHKQTIVDLRGVEFMDSTGLRILVCAHQDATADGRRFGIANAPDQVQRLLSLTGTTGLLALTDPQAEGRGVRSRAPLS
jgi:anti-sigma B factor antagonist